VPEITRPGLDLADDHQRAVATNPLVGPAPEREPARVVGVVAQKKVLAPQIALRDPGTSVSKWPCAKYERFVKGGTPST
jgi:hypothetical protein